jgi:hypothetical protein
MMVFGIPLLMIAVGGAEPDVRGAGDCPSASDVAAHLRPLLPRGGELPPDSWLELAVTPPAATSDAAPVRQIEVRLLTRNGATPIAARRLAVAGSCGEAAEAVAVVAASWMADYLTPPAPAPWLPQHATAAPTPTASALLTRSQADSPPSGTSAIVFDIGAGAGLTTATSGTSAPLLTAEMNVRRSDSASAARLVVLAAGTRTVDLGSGTAAWRRLVGGVGAARGWGKPAVFAQIGIDALAGATLIEGRGFASSGSSTSLDVGGAPWLRGGARLAALPITVWASAGAIGWLREQRVRVEGMPASAALPRLDLVLGAGLAWTPGAAKIDRR